MPRHQPSRTAIAEPQRAAEAAPKAEPAGTAARRPPPSAAPDLDSLLDMARRKSRDGRAELFTTVRDLFSDSGDALTERERALMGDILRRLVADVEVSLRRSLAEQLARDPRAPHALVVAMANDAIEVAHPILVASAVLGDGDLIEIVRHRTQSHQLAIASRRSLGPDVSEALVETGNVDVIATLLNNEGAEISDAVMAYLVEQSRQVDRFQEPLVRRADLPQHLARKMVWWVSAALRHDLARNHGFDGELLDETIDRAAKEELGEDPADESASPAERVVQQLKMSGRLDEQTMLQFLKHGEVQLFEAAFAALAGIRIKLVRRILFERGPEAIALACKACAFQEGTFRSIYRLSRDAIRRKGDKVEDEVELAVRLYRQIKPGHAQAVVRRWRRNPQYQYALNKLEASA